MASELILGIESSCDDTAAAVVDEYGGVLSSIVISQSDIHTHYGGVYPELASRAHIEKIIPAVKLALDSANVSASGLHTIGVTRGPGLIGSLMVGVDTARALGEGWRVPVRGVNHLRGHLRSADLDEKRVDFPATVLLVSGGHTLLAHMEKSDAAQLLGSTRDDSVGEAYDKVSRMLGEGYPGGPIVDRLALSGSPIFELPRPMIQGGLDFSFSGLKTAVRRLLEKHPGARKEDVAASFVAACMDVLLAKASTALDRRPSASLVVVGGVAASPQLRERASVLARSRGVRLSLPPQRWATDNAAMIALATWDYVRVDAGHDLRPLPTLSIERF